MCLVAIHSGERDVACQLVSHTNLVRAAWHLARRGQMLGCVYSFFAQPPPKSWSHLCHRTQTGLLGGSFG